MTMKIKIRKGFFETNSSSVHAICISKSKGSVPKKMELYFGEFGWELGVHDNTNSLPYILTYLLETNQFEEIVELLYKLRTKYNVEFNHWFGDTLFFEEILTKLENGEEININDYSSDFAKLQSKYYLDQYSEAKDIIEKILRSDDILERFLFGDSYIFTGNDNNNVFEETYGNELISLENTHDIYIKGN